MRVFDCHVHVQPWEQMRPEARQTMTARRRDLAEIQQALDDPSALLSLMDREGVERAALINYVAPEIMGFTSAANTWISRYVTGHEDRLVAVGSVHPRHTGDAGGETRRLFEDLGIRMLKIHPPHQLFAANAYLTGLDGLAEIYGAAERLGRPVMIHTGTSIFPGARSRTGEPMAVDDVAVDFPDLTLILAHGGRPLWMEQAVFLVRRFPQVYMDVSSIPPKRLLHYFPRLHELADKVLYGSDWPSPGVRGMGEGLREFKALGLPEDVQRKLLQDNAERLFPTP